MEIHRQTCQKCKSRNVRNLIVREDGSSDKIYVQCMDCRKFVARYILTEQGYYHHGKDFESYLKGLERGGHFESGKDFREDFDKIKETCLAEFEEVLKRLKELGKD
ncbi:MAG: hypothetical protein ACYTG7_11765 [Planctomycetota bacterium]|jgi:hypothetical protein